MMCDAYETNVSLKGSPRSLGPFRLILANSPIATATKYLNELESNNAEVKVKTYTIPILPDRWF